MALTLTATVAVTAAPADDAADLKLLQAKVATLEAKLGAATLKIEMLSGEVERLKGAGKGPAVAKPVAPGTLADALAEGTTIRGDFKFTTGTQAEGTGH